VLTISERTGRGGGRRGREERGLTKGTAYASVAGTRVAADAPNPLPRVRRAGRRVSRELIRSWAAAGVAGPAHVEDMLRGPLELVVWAET
jgi:hypothetical protein